jgi:hypothetical protein
VVVVVGGRTVVVVGAGGTVVVGVAAGVVVDGRLLVVVVVDVAVEVAVVAVGWLTTTAGSGSGALAVPSLTAVRSSRPACCGGPARIPSTNSAAVTAPTIAPAARRV